MEDHGLARRLSRALLRISSLLPFRIQMWRRWRFANAALSDLEQTFRPQIDDAKRMRDEEKVEDLERQYRFEASEYTDELWGMESRELVRRARRFDIQLADFTPTDREQGPWDEGHFDVYLTDEARRFLTRRIKEKTEIRSKPRRERVSFYAALVFGFSGVALTGYNAWRGSADNTKTEALRKQIEVQGARLASLEQAAQQPCTPAAQPTAPPTKSSTTSPRRQPARRSLGRR